MDPSAFSSPVAIRRVVEVDIDPVVALALRAWAPVFASFEQILGRGIYRLVYPNWPASQAAAVTTVCRGDHVFVAETAGQLAGFVAVVIREDHPRTAEVDMIAVEPAHQRRGVATALMQFALDHLSAAGVVLVDLATGGDPAHAPARATYEKVGFTALPLVRYYQAL